MPAALPRTLLMSLPVLSQASPTTTSLPAVVGAARVQVCELAPEEDCGANRMRSADVGNGRVRRAREPREKTAKRKKLLSVTSTKRFQRLDNLVPSRSPCELPGA
jgi:hypothetical protein